MLTDLIRTHFAIAITLLLMATSQAQAEITYRPPGDFGWRKSVPLHLILCESVVSDLELSDEVVGKLKDLLNRTKAEFKGPPLNGRRESLHAIQNKYTEQINNLLTQEQQTRLHQIHLQYGTLSSNARLFNLDRSKSDRDADVLSDAAVAKALELTDAQRKEIDSIHMAIIHAEIRFIKNGKKHVGPDYRDLWEQRSATIMNVLTSEQREALQKLKGRPLKIAQEKPRTSP